MKESYREGIASHPGPEPCEGSRKAALEALDRGIWRLGIELRNRVVQGADGGGQHRRQHGGGRKRESAEDPAESKTPGMQRNSMRENREAPPSPAGSMRAGRRRQ
jgi:hypothetical protein